MLRCNRACASSRRRRQRLPRSRPRSFWLSWRRPAAWLSASARRARRLRRRWDVQSSAACSSTAARMSRAGRRAIPTRRQKLRLRSGCARSRLKRVSEGPFCLRALRETSNNDLTDLEALLKAAGPNRPKLIACVSLYSMDGDVAPLGAVDEIALSDWIQRLPRYRFSIGPKVAEQGP